MGGKAIVRDGKTGEAVVAGTEVRVSSILEVLAESGSMAAVVERFPVLSADDVAAALAFAARSVRGPAEYAGPPAAGSAIPGRVREAAVAYGRANVDDEIFRVDARIAALSDEADFLRAIRGGLDDVRTGNLVPHDEAMAQLEAIFGR